MLKHAHPGWITGKLSDVAGLAFFPLFLQALWEAARAMARRPAPPSPRVLFACMVATTTVFALVKLVPWAETTFRYGLAALQWPLHAFAACASRAEVPRLAPVSLVADRTDLIALPAVLVALLTSRRRACPR